MAAKQLLPGFGSKYTSEAITVSSASKVGADTIDVARCAQFAVQVNAVTNLASSTVQVQQSFDGTNWADLGSAFSAALGTTSRFGAFSGPYGIIRLKVIDASNAAIVTMVVVGFEMQGKS